jgi:hypothetical protein
MLFHPIQFGKKMHSFLLLKPLPLHSSNASYNHIPYFNFQVSSKVLKVEMLKVFFSPIPDKITANFVKSNDLLSLLLIA